MIDTKLLDWLQKNPQCEISYSGWNDDPKWEVYKITGGRNDREWFLLADGDTVREALVNAMKNSKRNA